MTLIKSEGLQILYKDFCNIKRGEKAIQCKSKVFLMKLTDTRNLALCDLNVDIEHMIF